MNAVRRVVAWWVLTWLVAISFAQAQSAVTFGAPDFPAVGIDRVVDVPGAVVATTVDELNAALASTRVLVWRHGSTIPAASWPAIKQFLLRGGRWVHLGGEPWTRVVTGGPGTWRVEDRTTSILKELRLNQSRVEPAAGSRVRGVDGAASAFHVDALPDGATVSILEPRFTDTKTYPDEDGSPGAREAVAHPLAFVLKPNDDEAFPFASAAFAIDRIRGFLAGGRWVLRLLSKAPSAAEIAALLQEAEREAVDLRVRPARGCLQPGEPAVVWVEVETAAETHATYPGAMTITAPDGAQTVIPFAWASAFGRNEPVAVSIGTPKAAGIWRIDAQFENGRQSSSAFWVMDDALFRSGGTLAFDHQMLRKDGAPYPVVGTTFMSPSVHRDFLFEPNVAEWDEAFATFARLNLNLVRTGLWSGWDRAAEADGTPKEDFLRALEAYYLTARKHGIIVLFNVFAFMPPRFGGENAYLDPKAVAAQQRFVGGIAARFKDTKEFQLDLINEPSFCSEAKLWFARPSGDRFERDAFLAWLERTFASEGRVWQDEVRSRWRLLPDEPIGLPAIEDFDDGTTFGSKRPYRAQDWLRFANGAFRDWCFAMRKAVRDAGSPMAITVGQDEGGLLQRPHPQLMADALEYTSIHTWWWNDRLVFDGLAAKRRGKPMLVSETGVMNRELLSGDALRSLDDAKDLLERKLAAAFAAGAFGVVQWCWDVNPYMASDNECAIGIHRVDGSYKPEWKALARVAEFVAATRDEFDGYAEPSTVVVMSDVDRFSPRALEGFAAVHAAARNGTRVRIVLEPLARHDLDQATHVVLASTTGISDDAWRALVDAARAGARVSCSGYFEADEVGRHRERLGTKRQRLGFAGAEGVELPRLIAESGYGVIDVDEWTSHEIDGARIRHWTTPIDWAMRGYGRRISTSSVGISFVEPDGDLPNDLRFSPFGVRIHDVRYAKATLTIMLDERTGGSQGLSFMSFGRP
ncbi:MAG: hypothetical protein IT459_01870 [Planctomycetes bacterium]|nr:hypothetical protein [Planctomycetota bacterium]